MEPCSTCIHVRYDEQLIAETSPGAEFKSSAVDRGWSIFRTGEEPAMQSVFVLPTQNNDELETMRDTQDLKAVSYKDVP